MDYEKMYYFMVGAIESALEVLERKDYITAKQRLVEAQRYAEEQYLAAGDAEDDEKVLFFPGCGENAW